MDKANVIASDGSATFEFDFRVGQDVIFFSRGDQ